MTVDQVVFLVGGTGSRLGALTAETPKPVLPVGGRPFLDYLLDEASRYGFARCLLLCGYRADSIQKAYDGRSIRGMRVETAIEVEPAGTGRRPRPLRRPSGRAVLSGQRRLPVRLQLAGADAGRAR